MKPEQGIERRLKILRDWIEEGQSPYLPEGEVVFLRNLLQDIERLSKIESAAQILTNNPSDLWRALLRLEEAL